MDVIYVLYKNRGYNAVELLVKIIPTFLEHFGWKFLNGKWSGYLLVSLALRAFHSIGWYDFDALGISMKIYLHAGWNFVLPFFMTFCCSTVQGSGYCGIAVRVFAWFLHLCFCYSWTPYFHAVTVTHGATFAPCLLWTRWTPASSRSLLSGCSSRKSSSGLRSSMIQYGGTTYKNKMTTEIQREEHTPMQLSIGSVSWLRMQVHANCLKWHHVNLPGPLNKCLNRQV